MAGLNDVFGGSKYNERIKQGSPLGSQDKSIVDFPRLPINIFPLDYSLAGGIPFNVGTQLYGAYQSGKSTLAYLMAKSLSRFCMRCMKPLGLCTCETPDIKKTFLCHTEGTPPDEFYFQTLGYDPIEHLVMGTPRYGEEAADMIEAAIQADDCGLVILDSLVGISPRAELEGSYEDAQVGLQARLLGKMSRRLNSILAVEYRRGHHVAVVFLNQMRSVLGNTNFGPSETVPGGWAIKHFYRCSIRIGQLSGDTKKHDVDTSVNMKNSLRFSASLLGPQSKQQMLLLAGKCEYRVCVREAEELRGFKAGTVLDWNSTVSKARELGILEKQGADYQLEGTTMHFRRLGDIERVFQTGRYVEKKSGEVIEGADDVIRYLVVQAAKQKQIQHILDRGGKVQKLCGEG